MKPFITLENITVRIRDKFLFENTDWVMHERENWLIIGRNGAGKTTLVKAIAGELSLKQGEIILNFLGDVENPYPFVHRDKISYLSFESHQKLVEQDNFKKDLQEFSGKKIKGMQVKDYLRPSFWEAQRLQDPFNIEHLLHQEISTLSTGEARKVQIIHSLLKKPKLFILDEPFEGLDQDSKKDLTKIIENLNGIQLILITHRVNEIPKNISNIMVLEDGHIKVTGKKEDIKDIYSQFTTSSSDLIRRSSIADSGSQIVRNDKTVLEMKNIIVALGKKQILKNINWTIKEGENWALLGPNGSGKSTLIKLILGDHPQAFSNDIKVFGKKLGVGISIWDIKQNIGFVLNELILKFPKETTSLQVILSGFFDSVGLYKKVSALQDKIAGTWIKNLEIQDIINKNFSELSFGQKQIILVARSLVKNPKLLILDEPMSSLDVKNRKRVLNIIGKVSKSKTNILYITHNEDELVSTITHKLYLEKGQVVGLV